MTNSDVYKQLLSRRVARWGEFHGRKEAGDLMVAMWGDRGPSLEGFLTNKFHEHGTEKMIGRAFLTASIEEYVASCRTDGRAEVTRFDDDCVPTALVYWGIGGCNAAITGGECVHSGWMCWYEPERSWEQIAKLKFDPANKWVQFALAVNQELWRLWEEDFHILPFLYRSPLDAANGVRGNELFLEMYTDPAAVHRLIDWCVDWTLEMERFLAANSGVAAPAGWGRAVWSCWLPDGGVFVNGDPVGLISREMAVEFEQPYTGRLFQATGGGFYHNHTVGLYQTEMVGKTPGNLMHYYVDDPRQPSAAKALLNMPEMREEMLASSLETPIGLYVTGEQLDAILDIARRGRFLIILSGQEGDSDASLQEMIDKVRRVSNID